MNLKTKVLVKNISNLSDARFCAGMMVDYIGFNIQTIPANTFKEIKNWISGIENFIEISGNLKDIHQILQDYPADGIILKSSDFSTDLSELNLPIFLEIDLEKDNLPDLLALAKPYVKAFLVNGNTYLENLETWAAQYPLIINYDLLPEKELNQIETSAFQGLFLEGGMEERPGYKDFSDLIDKLEALEA